MKNKNLPNISTEAHDSSADFEMWKSELQQPTTETLASERQHETDSATEANRAQAEATGRNAKNSIRERHARQEANMIFAAGERSDRDPSLHRAALSYTKKLGRTIGRFTRRAAIALRSAKESWQQTAPTPSPSYDTTNWSPTLTGSFADKRASMLQDAAEQYHRTQRMEHVATHAAPETPRPIWTGGLVMAEDGTTYYKPSEQEAQPKPEDSSDGHTEEQPSQPIETSPADIDNKPVLSAEQIAAQNAAEQAEIAEYTRRQSAREARAAWYRQDKADREEAVHAPQQQTETPSAQPEEYNDTMPTVGEFVASSTTPDSMEEVIKSFDPTRKYTYQEAMEMIPDKRGYRNFWENSLSEDFGKMTQENLRPIAQALVVKSIHEQIANTRKAMEAGRLPKDGKIRANLGTITGSAGIGNEYIRQLAAQRGIIDNDPNSFQADGMSFRDLAGLLDIDPSSINGYDELFV